MLELLVDFDSWLIVLTTVLVVMSCIEALTGLVMITRPTSFTFLEMQRYWRDT
jgi:hypothetical protein